MLLPVTFGVGEIFVTVLIQATTVVIILRRLTNFQRSASAPDTFFGHTFLLAGIMVILFLGHLLQILAWALPFRLFGQFDDLTTAFYHSTVNYTSLGYGDIVMDESWRLLGALEAANGILMFGVSTATFFTIMLDHLRQHANFISQYGNDG